jgi:hypothetical protein
MIERMLYHERIAIEGAPASLDWKLKTGRSGNNED